jgi:hypothetical protein
MKVELELNLNRLNREPERIVFSAKRMFNAGWVGSDRKALQHHIDELALIGVPVPRHIPTLLALGNHLLTNSADIQVHGPETSGEVEWVLLWHRGEILVTTGSDHTDRKLETVSVAKSKNMCLNVIARDLWPYEEVKDHFGELRLHCTVTRNGKVSLYQEAPCAAILPPGYWIEDLRKRLGRLEDGLVLFSGTIGTVAGLVAGDGYDFELHDPVLNRTIRHGYTCEVMAGAIETF